MRPVGKLNASLVPNGPFLYMISRAYKIRLYPTVRQQKFFARTFGTCRFIYNRVIALKSALYEETRMPFTPKLASFKEEWPWMREADSQGMANVYMDALNAYQKFFNGQSKYPKYKKKCDNQSYRNAMMPKAISKLIRGTRNDRIFIPKAGLVKFRQDYDFKSLPIKKICSLTISKSATGKYFCSITCEVDDSSMKLPPNKNEIGIDLGIKDFLIDSDGCVIDNPKYLKRSEVKLAKAQRRLSLCKKGSNNYLKQKHRVALVHEKIRNQRIDFQHKVSKMLVVENQYIYSEDLKPSNMLKNHRLAKAIADASFGRFCDMVAYKAMWYGRYYFKVGSFYPSSKLCHVCGYKNTTLTLEDREWTCPHCGTYLDRDHNAAINILNEGNRIRLCGYTVRTTEADKSTMLVDTGKSTCLERESCNATDGLGETHPSSVGG